MATIGHAVTTPDSAVNTGDRAFASPLLTMPEAGTFTSISVWGVDEGAGTQEAVVRAYDASGNTLGTSGVLTGFTGGGSWVSASISFARTNGQQVQFAIISEGPPLYIGRSTMVNSQYVLDQEPLTYPTWPADPISTTLDGDNPDFLIAIYGTYTPPGSKLLLMMQYYL